MRLQNMCVLSEAEIKRIHAASLEILEKTGIRVDHPEALDLLAKHGAKVDAAAQTAKLPPPLVEACIASTPKTFDLYDRNGANPLRIGTGTPYLAAGHNAVFVIDADSSERRKATVKDVADFAAIADALADIDIVGVPVTPQDVSSEFGLVYACKALFENTVKPLFFSTESSAVNSAIVKMMKIVAGREDIGSRPNAICQLSPTSPLFWEKGATQALLDIAAEGVPLNILPEPMSGMSAPYSVSGLLVIHNAEVLSGLVLGQCRQKGAPLMYGASWTTYDMKYMSAIIASPETHILRIAGCQMARHYGIPSHTTAPNSDGNLHDEQNAWERSISNLCGIFAGNDIVMNCGMFATGLTVSNEQLVLDNEVNGILRRMHRGIEVTDDLLGLEAIHEVGPKGDFMMAEHTVSLLYSGEFRESDLVKPITYDRWRGEGAKDIAKIASERAKEILAKGPGRPIDGGIRAKLDEVVKNLK